MAQPRPSRIVIVRPSALGDVCRSVPVLASVRAAHPQAHIAWVVQDDFAPAIESHPALDEVITFPRSRFADWWKSPARANELRRWFADLRRRRFDAALDCQGLSRSGLITAASGARMRIGLRSAREFAWLCYNRRVPLDGAALPGHAVDQMLCVLEAIDVPALRDMRLYISSASAEWWMAQRAALGVDNRAKYAVLAPGSRWPSKRWPIERFAALVDPLLQRGFARVIVIGSPSERDQIAPLFEASGRHGIEASSVGDPSMPGCLDASTPRVIDLVGRTTIAQTMAVIAEAGLVIANDSAPLHMAVGFDRPCVALYGPTDPVEVGPYGFAECVVRAYRPPDGAEPNFKDPRLGDSLMRLISTAMVLQTIDRVLSLWPTRRRDANVAASPLPAGSSNASPTTSDELRNTIATTAARSASPKAAS